MNVFLMSFHETFCLFHIYVGYTIHKKVPEIFFPPAQPSWNMLTAESRKTHILSQLIVHINFILLSRLKGKVGGVIGKTLHNKYLPYHQGTTQRNITSLLLSADYFSPAAILSNVNYKESSLYAVTSTIRYHLAFQPCALTGIAETLLFRGLQLLGESQWRIKKRHDQVSTPLHLSVVRSHLDTWDFYFKQYITGYYVNNHAFGELERVISNSMLVMLL